MPVAPLGTMVAPMMVSFTQKKGGVHSASALHGDPGPTVVLSTHVCETASQCWFGLLVQSVALLGLHGLEMHCPLKHVWLLGQIAPLSILPSQSLSLPSHTSGAPGWTFGSLSSQSTFCGWPWSSRLPHQV